MRLAINLIGLKKGGGLTVALNFLNEIQNFKDQSIEYHVFVHEQVNIRKYGFQGINIIELHPKLSSPFTRMLAEYQVLKWCGKLDIDSIFNFGNMAIPSKYHQSIVLMLPWFVYQDFVEVWSRLGLMERWLKKIRNWVIYRRIKFASVVFPQTETYERRLRKKYRGKISTKVVPMGFSHIGIDQKYPSRIDKKNGEIYLLALTKYYVHKNLEILIEVAEIFKYRKEKFRIILTLDNNQHQNVKDLLGSICRRNLDDYVINIGEIPYQEVPSLYQEVDALLLPTLLESYSATYVDSLYFEKPIFTSDLDFAKESCGGHAIFFNPFDADDIAKSIKESYDNPEKLKVTVEEGKTFLRNRPSWKTIAETYLEEIQKSIK